MPDTPVLGRRQAVALTTESIVNRTMRRQKALDLTWRFESPHLAFPLPARLVRDLGPIVEPPVLPVFYARHENFLNPFLLPAPLGV